MHFPWAPRQRFSVNRVLDGARESVLVASIPKWIWHWRLPIPLWEPHLRSLILIKRDEIGNWNRLWKIVNFGHFLLHFLVLVPRVKPFNFYFVPMCSYKAERSWTQSTRLHKMEKDLSNFRSVISTVFATVPDFPLSGIAGLWANGHDLIGHSLVLLCPLMEQTWTFLFLSPRWNGYCSFRPGLCKSKWIQNG